MNKPSQDSSDLKESLFFLNIKELKELCVKLSLAFKGKKIELINRIVHFVEHVEKLITPKFPQNVYAKKGTNYDLSPNAYILKNAYKNDLKTRMFFKNIIGDHFHFTAYGQDWINYRWLNGNPPTYQEFADM